MLPLPTVLNPRPQGRTVNRLRIQSNYIRHRMPGGGYHVSPDSQHLELPPAPVFPGGGARGRSRRRVDQDVAEKKWFKVNTSEEI